MFFLDLGYNHGRDCFKIVDADTGRVVHSRNVTWYQPRELLISPAPTVGSGVSYLSTRAETLDYVNIQPTPAATATPPAAPATAAPVPALAVAAPAPAPLSNLPASIPDRIDRKLGHEADVRMPGRMRGESRAMRDSHHSMSMMPHASLAQRLATREVSDEAFREHDLPKAEIDLPTIPASDLPTPSTIAQAEASEHDEIWPGSRTREFSGLLQAHTFGPVSQSIGNNVIDAKLLFSWKSNELGWIRKAKSRLIARGFKQREGIDFGETFAPTVSSYCVRLLSAIDCKLDLDVCHFNVWSSHIAEYVSTG